MKTKSVLMLTVLTAVALVFAACSSSDDLIVQQTEEDPQVLGGPVKAQFTISIPQSSKENVTRMSDQTVQAAQTLASFRGINDIMMFPSAELPANISTTSLIGKNIALTQLLIPSLTNRVDNYIPKGTLFEMANSKSILYGDVQLQIGTRTFLFYGKAIEVSENTDATSPDQFFTFGHLDATGFDGTPENVSQFKFSPRAITTSAFSTAKRSNICTYLNSIANAKVAGDAGEKWSETTNLGWLTLYNNFTGMKAGSSTNLQVAIRDLYFALIDDNNALPQAICTAINNATYVTINTTDKTVTFKDIIAGYPSESDNLPDGAAVLAHTTEGFAYVETSDNYSGMNVTSIDHFAYPASLYYWGKSGVLTSETSQQDNFTAEKTWDDNATTGLFNSFTDGSAISSKTRSVLLTEPVQYGVGRLDVSVSITNGAATIPDNGTGSDAHNVNPSNIKLTGILIGGQKNVGWDFTPVAGTEYTVYDNILKSQKPAVGDFNGLGLSTGTNNYISRTLVLESQGKVGDVQDKVKVALEFVNIGDDFIGMNGIVAKNTKFYLVGELDVAAALTAAAGDNDKVAKINQIGKVFKQDYVTKAQFSIKNLTKAQNTIPDLRNPKVELGLSVNLEWEDGITFVHEFD